MPHARIRQTNTLPIIKRNISGVLLLDKSWGVSSNKALQAVKQIFSASKCGHTGTLDPMATGLLPICFGEATKFSSLLLGADKTYEATLRLGFLSTTGDAEGEIMPTQEAAPDPTVAQCEQVLQRFIGRIRQIPPMYSALKHQGKPLYAYARKGESIERKAREVHIHEIMIRLLTGNELTLIIRCGTGTYIRTLAEDIGKALGCGGAYLTSLRRTTIDCFNLQQAQTLDSLKAMEQSVRDDCLLSIDSLLTAYPSLTLDEPAATHILQGRMILGCESETLGSGIVRLYNRQQQFLGLGELDDQKLTARRMLANLE